MKENTTCEHNRREERTKKELIAWTDGKKNMYIFPQRQVLSYVHFPYAQTKY